MADGGKSGPEVTDFIATSPDFTLNSPTKLQFSRLQASAKTTLKVCVNSDQNCPWRYTDFSRNWVQEEINLDPTSLHLDSDNKAKVRRILIPNLRFTELIPDPVTYFLPIKDARKKSEKIDKLKQ